MTGRAWRLGGLRCGASYAPILILCVSQLVGCGSVAPYERGKLAHRTMKLDDASSSGQAHVYAIHEGAVGGTVGVASGCGCN